MKVTQTRHAPHKRARIRAFFAEGVEKLHLPWAVEALPALLHLSLFLFFAGLAVYLFNINHTVFKVAISWIGFCTGMYMCITLMPIIRHDSPYYAPLSSPPWYLYTGTLAAVFGIFERVTDRAEAYFGPSISSINNRIFVLWSTYQRRITRGMEKECEQTALDAPSAIDGRALNWTYESLDEDHELEQFFAGISGFCNSTLVHNPHSSLEGLRDFSVASALNRLLERTWSSNLVPETIKQRRLVTCVRAIDAAYLDRAACTILGIFFDRRPALFQSVELGHSLICWGNDDDGKTSLFSQVIISRIISNVPQRNERWFLLTMHHLGISDVVLRSYLDHGNSVSLAILIHLIRHFVHNSFENRWQALSYSHNEWLQLDFDVQNTLPGLQHEFCDLWNEAVLKGRDSANYTLFIILEKVCAIYDTLHQGSTLNHEYHLCSIPAHRIRSISTLIKVDGDKQAETAGTPIITPLYRHDPLPSVIPPVTKCDTPPSLTSNLPHSVVEQSRNVITPAALSFRLAPLDNDQISNSIQGTTVPSAISYLTNAGSRSTSGNGTASRLTGNMTTATPSLVPDTLSSPIPLRTVSSDPASPHISADLTVGQSGRSPEDRSTPHPPSQIATPFPLASGVTSCSDLNAATEMRPLDAPDRTLDPNPRIMSQPFTPSSPDVTEYSLRPKDGDLSETSGRAYIYGEMTEKVTVGLL